MTLREMNPMAMSDDEIDAYPDKALLIKAMQKRQAELAAALFTLEQKSKREDPELVRLRSELSRSKYEAEQYKCIGDEALDTLIRIGFMGDDKYLCTTCKKRVRARKVASPYSADKFVCVQCQNPVKEILKIDPAAVTLRNEELREWLTKATADAEKNLRKVKYDHQIEVKKLSVVLQDQAHYILRSKEIFQNVWGRLDRVKRFGSIKGGFTLRRNQSRSGRSIRL
jgi:hypothetical protein